MAADKLLLCLIIGPSGSGKTSTALELQKRFFGSVSSVDVIHQDHYFTKPFLPYRDRIDDSYENGFGIDWEKLVEDVGFRFLGVSGKETGDNGDEDCEKDVNDGVGVKIVIVEGHILGVAAELFRERFLVHENICIVVVILVGCSQEICRRRRLERKKDRSEEELKELAKYFDAFVWPSFLKYGIAAIDAIRRNLVRPATTKAADKHFEDSPQHRNVFLEIRNSEGASLEENIFTISHRIFHILQN